MSTTALPIMTCRKLLGLLGEFYEELPEPPVLQPVVVYPATIPQPQRQLLVHESDMTSTLEAFHGERLALDVLQQRVNHQFYARHIVLRTAQSGRPVEYGASRVCLGLLGERVRAEVLAARQPLGQVLNEHRLDYRACPGAFFKIHANDVMLQLFELDEPEWLFGRCGCLADSAGRSIAEVVEILPP